MEAITQHSSSSSSEHELNADLPLDLYQQKLWFNLNIENNSKPHESVDSKLKLKRFHCDVTACWSLLDAGLTPSRKLSNIFWLNLPWERLQNRFDSIRIMDFGCSVGNYALNFMKWTDIRFQYHGFDVRRGDIWAERSKQFPNLKFTHYDGEFKRECFSEDFNFFMSQSALEHVAHDLTYFRVISEYLKKSQKPSIQIHLVPAAECLQLYGLHGVRQYTPRTLSNITRLFSEGICTLFCLGGSACNHLHMQAITLPAQNNTVDWRQTNSDKYEILLKKAISRDMEAKSKEVNFYALVIETNTATSGFLD